MHEWVETGLSAVLLALLIAGLISFILPPKLKERSSRQIEVLKLRRQAEEEEEHIGQQATLEYTSMLLSKKKICALCLNPAAKLCSRCKAVRYCSQECQHQHWKQGHKYECVPVKVVSGKSSAKVSPIAETPVAPVALPTSAEQKSLAAAECVPPIPEAAQEVPTTPVTGGTEIEAAPPESASRETPAATPAEEFTAAPAPVPVALPKPVPTAAPEPPPDPAPVPVPAVVPAAPSPAAPSPAPTPVLASAPIRAETPAEPTVAAQPEILPEENLSKADELAPEAPGTPADGKLSKPKKILFPYEAFVKFFNWDMLRLPPCGLINCGNSCFANVVLQCLTYTRPLTAYLVEGIHGEDCRRNDWCFMCELQQHVCRVKQSQIPFSPIRILSRIRNIGNHLGYGRQEDAHEFMRFAIDSMQSTCLDEFGGEKAVDPRTQETTLIHHIFGGHLQSQVKCMRCQHESNRYESMMDLAVEIQGFVESLEDALAQFTAPECLDGDNKYKCDRCNAYVQARKRLAVHEAPNVLTVALKRFQSGKFGKLNKRVTFPEVLDISPYMSGKGDYPPAYQLYAVVVHVDMLNASFFGHYICYVKNSLGSWYKIDDSKVKEVDLDKVLAQKAYMLLYSRSHARPAPVVGSSESFTFAKEQTSVGDGIAVANGHYTSGHPSSRLRAFASKVPGVMPAITGTLFAENGSLQRVGEGHGSSWIQNGRGLVVSLDSVSPWTGDVEMMSINADDSTDDGQKMDSGYPDVDQRMSVGESNEDRQQVPVACCGPSDVPSDQLLTLKAGKRRLDTGVSDLSLWNGFDTNWLPSWPSTGHSRSSSCPSSLQATSDCLMSSSSVTRDVCSVRATDSVESEYSPLDIDCNEGGYCPDAGERGEVADFTPESFQAELVTRAKRQHIEYESNGVPATVTRTSESSESTMDMELAEIDYDEPDYVSEAKLQDPGPEAGKVSVSGSEQTELVLKSSSGVELEAVEESSTSLSDLSTRQCGMTNNIANWSSSNLVGSLSVHQGSEGAERRALLEESVSSVADDSSSSLDGGRVIKGSNLRQVASDGRSRDDGGLKSEEATTSTGVGVSNSNRPRAQIKPKPLFSPGFLLTSKRKTGEGNKVASPKADSNKVKTNVIVDTNKHLRGIGQHNAEKVPLYTSVVESGDSKESPLSRVKSTGVNGSGGSGENGNGASLVVGESSLLPMKESQSSQFVRGVHNGGKGNSRLKQGRNEICACGSQRKWKKCCGKADVMKVETRRVVV